MGSEYKIVKILREADWQPFHSFIMRRGVTINDAHGWLVDRGYSIHRSTAANYIGYYRNACRRRMRAAAITGTDAEIRRRVCAAVGKMSGPHLADVALFVAFVADVALGQALVPATRAAVARKIRKTLIVV